MGSKSPPGIPKNLRVPQDLLKLIDEVCERERKTFSEVVISKLWLTYSEDWNYTGMRIKEINRELKILNHEKISIKKIRHKRVIGRKEKKLERERLEFEAAEEEEEHRVERLIRHMNILRDHLEGREELWVHNDEPMNFMRFDEEPWPNFRKLASRQLNPELLEFYNENFHLLN